MLGGVPCKGLELGSFMVQLNQNLADVARQLVCKKVNGSKRLLMIDDGRAYFVIRRKHPSQNMSSLLKVSNEPNLKYIYSSLSKMI